MSTDERVKLHAQGDRDAIRRLERERVATQPRFDPAHLAGADARGPLELALVQAGGESEYSDSTADVAADAHGSSMAGELAGAKVSGGSG